MNIDWIIAGLGNPGSRYAETRHNIGFMVCQYLCEKHQTSFLPGKGDWYQAVLRLRGKGVLVMLPTTYMNNSGEAIIKAMRMHDIAPPNLMIVVDEYNFPVGKVHLKLGGSDGGHNGTTSVIDELQSQNFWRLRCGIAKNFGQGELVEYVLRPFNPEEMEARNSMIKNAADAIEYVMHAGVARATSAINSGKKLFPDISKKATEQQEKNNPEL